MKKSNNLFSRRNFIKTAAGAAMGLTLKLPDLKAAEPKSDTRPNILWITMEDSCPQFFGCYGNKSARTPNMDRLAARGIRFKSAFSTAPVCAPSRSNIITGCLPEVLGSGNHRSRYPIPEQIKGFPYYLRRAGYFTSNNLKTDYNLAGEKHFVSEAWNECFGSGGWGTSYQNNQDTFDETSREAGWWHRKPGQPFFSVFNLFNSHQSRTMTFPERWYVEKILDKLPEKDRILPEDIEMPPFYRDTPEMRRHVCRVYNSLQLTDREFGKILDRLEKDGLAEVTVIFCFADHGEGIPRAKMSAMGTGFQVPFIVYIPPKFKYLSPWPMGEANDELVSSSDDAAPTVLSLAGVTIPKYMTGRPLLGQARRVPRPYVWASRNRIDESPDLSRAVTDGRYFYCRVFMPQLPQVKYAKYMDVGDITRVIRADYNAGHLNDVQAALVKPEQPSEYLFDLQNDPWQIRNLAEDPGHKTDLERLSGALQSHLREIRDVHFLPEYELARRAKNDPPYNFRLDDKSYPFEKILETANLSGGGEAVMDDQLRALQDSDATVRYWAAVGLDAQGGEVKPYEKEITAALNDSSPCVQIVAAGIACKVFGNDEARRRLRGWIQNDDRNASLLALQTIEYMRDKARPFAPALWKFQRQLTRDPPAKNYDTECAAETTLHFLEGAPLYYPEFARWLPKAQTETDTAVHFER